MKMNEQEMNVAIAVECGWKFVRRLDMSLHNRWWLEPEKEWSRYTPEFQASSVQVELPDEWGGNTHGGSLPNYCNDLNVMHEAERTLRLAQFWDYADELNKIVSGELGKDSYISATARQRAEAFLRTLGKWQEPATHPNTR